MASNCFFIDCKGDLPDLYTTSILTPAIIPFVVSSSNPIIVYLAEYPDTCWKVDKAGTVTPALTYNILNTFSQCVTCIDAIPEPPIVNVYILEDCSEVLTPLYSFSSELALAENQVVNLVGYPNVCWSVSTVVFDDQTITEVTILENEAGVKQIFDDCTCCLPAPEPAPVKYTRVIPKPDRKFYQITQSQCDVNANIKFAENYYRYFKKLKYGINSMCDNINLDKVWIQKKLSDLAVINDPTACTIVTPPTPIICPEPS